jgi:tetratricopeptide (TPR) repeat protein
VRKARVQRPAPVAPSVAPAKPSRSYLLYLALLVGTLAIYASVRQFDFVNFDDPDYVTANAHVRNGLTGAGLIWAFTSGEAANWFPVTRISHMLDSQLFGLNSGWHHLVNVLLHALASLLVLAFLHRATKALWPSAFVAAVFALHPLHVESVAWVAERKDVLSAVFWFLTLLFYVRYVERPSTGRYVAALGVFALGLMSKPMLVTLPAVLVLLDLWPLRRGMRLKEKIPFAALAAASAMVTYAVQQGSGAVRTLATFPLLLRAENAIVTYAVYLGKTLWPAGLAVFYPYPGAIPMWQVAVALLIVGTISYAVWRSYRTRPYLAVGWLWYLGTLVPVIGLVQVGAQARADRYMYIPMVGMAIMLAWGAADLVAAFPSLKKVATPLAAAACAGWAALTWVQVQYWQNSETLFRHALEVTERNEIAEHNLGVALTATPGKLPEAITHLQAAVAIAPESARAHTDLGSALAKTPGRVPEAVAEFETALRLSPGDPIPQNNLAAALAKLPGRAQDAVTGLEAAVRGNPDDPELHNNLGGALAKERRLPEAVTEFQTALRLKPDYAEAHNNLGSVLIEIPGRAPDAIAEYQAALRADPNYAEAHDNLGMALASIPGRLPEAISHYEAAIRLRPYFTEAHINLGSALAAIPERAPEAIAHYEAALGLDPNSAEAHYNLGVTLSRIEGRLPEAIAHLETAIRLKPDYAEAHNNLGVVLSGVPGRSREALAHFEAAVRIKPDYEDARYNLTVARQAGR